MRQFIRCTVVALLLLITVVMGQKPTGQPTRQPTTQPSDQPTTQPTRKPSTPTGQPSMQPSRQPSTQPSRQPSTQPSTQPSSQPTRQPTSQPSTHPSCPTSQPSQQPTSQPSTKPSLPTGQPSSKPSTPTGQPSCQPSSKPSVAVISPIPPPPIISPLTLDSSLIDPVSNGPPLPFYPLNFGDHVFGAIVLVLCAGISSHLCFGYSTKKSRETFILLILLLIIGFQFFHIIRAALYIPATRFFVFNEEFHRSDCLESNKGGKKPFRATAAIDLNPCFCLEPAICILEISGEKIGKGLACPTDGTARCMSGDDKKTEIKAYISHFRNCIGGQGPSCTQDQPCSPCGRETLPDFSGSGKNIDVARCRTCSTEFNGDCNFIPGFGPYCYSEKGSKRVEPCKRCCTEPAPLFYNGTCY